MLESLGHLHPIVIHFPLALLISGGLFSLGSRLIRPEGLRHAFQVAGAWNFRIGALFILPALITGWAAFQTVAHDAPSHAAMTLHRNWALATGAAFLGMGVIAWRSRVGSWPTGRLTWAALFIGLALLGVTGYLGGILVYRHGLGVQALPVAEGDGHSHGSVGHSHGEALGNQKEPKAPVPNDSAVKSPPEPHHHDGTPHQH